MPSPQSSSSQQGSAASGTPREAPPKDDPEQALEDESQPAAAPGTPYAPQHALAGRRAPTERMSPREMAVWQQTRVKDLWRIFQIMSEFVNGFETLAELGPCVSVFGSARTQPHHRWFEMARQVSRELVDRGFGVITGGGPGIMEAANQGAHEAGGVSVGLNINIPHEQQSNHYIDADKLINFDFFFVRKVMFMKYAQGFVALPGGFGTLDELAEALTLIQTGKSTRFPVVLIDTAFWSGLIDWLRETVLEAGNISPGDMDLFQMTDDPAEAAEIIDAFYREHALTPNF